MSVCVSASTEPTTMVRMATIQIIGGPVAAVAAEGDVEQPQQRTERRHLGAAAMNAVTAVGAPW